MSADIASRQFDEISVKSFKQETETLAKIKVLNLFYDFQDSQVCKQCFPCSLHLLHCKGIDSK